VFSDSIVNKSNLYRNRHTQCVAVRLDKSSDVAKPVAILAELQFTYAEKSDPKIRKDFGQRFFYNCRKGGNDGPCFTERKQVGDIFTIKFTNLLMPTIFEISLDGQLKDVSGLSIKRIIRNTYRMCSVLNKENYFNDFIERHKESENQYPNEFLYILRGAQQLTMQINELHRKSKNNAKVWMNNDFVLETSGNICKFSEKAMNNYLQMKCEARTVT
jgi:hypothetical protein